MPKYSNRSKSALVIIGIITILVVVVGGGILAWKHYQKVSSIPSSQIADWKTYKNDEYGFEIKYPDDWMIDISGRGGMYDSGDISFCPPKMQNSTSFNSVTGKKGGCIPGEEKGMVTGSMPELPIFLVICDPKSGDAYLNCEKPFEKQKVLSEDDLGTDSLGFVHKLILNNQNYESVYKATASTFKFVPTVNNISHSSSGRLTYENGVYGFKFDFLNSFRNGRKYENSLSLSGPLGLLTSQIVEKNYLDDLIPKNSADAKITTKTFLYEKKNVVIDSIQTVEVKSVVCYWGFMVPVNGVCTYSHQVVIPVKNKFVAIAISYESRGIEKSPIWLNEQSEYVLNDENTQAVKNVDSSLNTIISTFKFTK